MQMSRNPRSCGVSCWAIQHQLAQELSNQKQSLSSFSLSLSFDVSLFLVLSLLFTVFLYKKPEGQPFWLFTFPAAPCVLPYLLHTVFLYFKVLSLNCQTMTLCTNTSTNMFPAARQCWTPRLTVNKILVWGWQLQEKLLVSINGRKH